MSPGPSKWFIPREMLIKINYNYNESRPSPETPVKKFDISLGPQRRDFHGDCNVIMPPPYADTL